MIASPASLQLSDFAKYPPQARDLAQRYLPTLTSLPVAFLAVFLRELMGYDWQFPVERAETEAQLHTLRNRGDLPNLQQTLARFDSLPIAPCFQRTGWAAQPSRAVEEMTAFLWSAGAMDAFHVAGAAYGDQLAQIRVQQEKVRDRLCIVIVGRDATGEQDLFRHLRPHGICFENVSAGGGLKAVMSLLEKRAQADPVPYAHWYVDGGETHDSGARAGVNSISYGDLAPTRRNLLQYMVTARSLGSVGPEELRSRMMQMGPTQLGNSQGGSDEVLRHFELSVLTEGAGTQIFSTTFVQWTARELLRRARPDTLVLRYAPRQADRPMNELISVEDGEQELDPRGSLVDAEMGAYYTWINLNRLHGEENCRFIAWHESGTTAIAVSPALAKGTVSTQTCDVEQLLHWSLG
jgi:hypothetical protein